MRFYDRKEAGRLLAERLSRYAGRDDVLVLGLPRGGVPVAYEVARALRAPLDVFVVRKLGAPDQPELALGAVAVPVAADQTCGEFRDDVDEVVCVFTPEPFYAVGLWYENFQQTNDEEVRRLLQEAIAA